MQTATGYCRTCNRQTMLVKQTQLGHGCGHAILFILTFGLWGIVWGVALVGAAAAPWRCNVCGTRTQRSWLQ